MTDRRRGSQGKRGRSCFPPSGLRAASCTILRRGKEHAQSCRSVPPCLCLRVRREEQEGYSASTTSGGDRKCSESVSNKRRRQRSCIRCVLFRDEEMGKVSNCWF